MKLATVSLLSLAFAGLLCYGATKVAESIADRSRITLTLIEQINQ